LPPVPGPHGRPSNCTRDSSGRPETTETWGTSIRTPGPIDGTREVRRPRGPRRRPDWQRPPLATGERSDFRPSSSSPPSVTCPDVLLPLHVGSRQEPVVAHEVAPRIAGGESPRTRPNTTLPHHGPMSSSRYAGRARPARSAAARLQASNCFRGSRGISGASLARAGDADFRLVARGDARASAERNPDPWQAHGPGAPPGIHEGVIATKDAYVVCSSTSTPVRFSES